MLTVAPERTIGREAGSLLSLLEGSLGARNQLGWSRWLQGEIQHFLPHDAVVTAWGDFQAGALAYDVIARNPALSARSMQVGVVQAMMVSLFQRWLASDLQPVVFDAKDLRSVCPAIAALAPCALVHGIEDHRGRYDCMYLFLGPWELASPLSRQLCRVVLPFIDAGFRQLPENEQAHPHDKSTESDPARAHFAGRSATPMHGDFSDNRPGDGHWTDGGTGERGSALSPRELEIMHWVRMGKTNSEIAIILNLSTFTVKNHMRRIYKKLDVLNRAQAVGSLDRMLGTLPSERPVVAGAASPSSRILMPMRNTA